MQSNAHTEKQSHMFIQIYSSCVSPRSKWSKEISKREAVSAEVCADIKIYALPSEKTQEKNNVSVSTEKKKNVSISI